MATHYPEVFKNLLSSCTGYRSGSVDLAAFKAAVWNAAECVVAVDEKSYRDMLQSAEGKLDMIQFTTDKAKVFEATLSVVCEIESMVDEALGTDSEG